METDFLEGQIRVELGNSYAFWKHALSKSGSNIYVNPNLDPKKKSFRIQRQSSDLFGEQNRRINGKLL